MPEKKENGKLCGEDDRKRTDDRRNFIYETPLNFSTSNENGNERNVDKIIEHRNAEEHNSTGTNENIIEDRLTSIFPSNLRCKWSTFLEALKKKRQQYFHILQRSQSNVYYDKNGQPLSYVTLLMMKKEHQRIQFEQESKSKVQEENNKIGSEEREAQRKPLAFSEQNEVGFSPQVDLAELDICRSAFRLLDHYIPWWWTSEVTSNYDNEKKVIQKANLSQASKGKKKVHNKESQGVENPFRSDCDFGKVKSSDLSSHPLAPSKIKANASGDPESSHLSTISEDSKENDISLSGHQNVHEKMNELKNATEDQALDKNGNLLPSIQSNIILSSALNMDHSWNNDRVEHNFGNHGTVLKQNDDENDNIIKYSTADILVIQKAIRSMKGNNGGLLNGASQPNVIGNDSVNGPKMLKSVSGKQMTNPKNEDQ